MSTTEIFKPLPYPFDHYEVSVEGHLRAIATKRLISAPISGDGYVRVGLKRGFDAVRVVYLHRMVALMHVPGDTSLQVNHKDLCKHNNCASNLEWVTRSDNNKHPHTHRPELAVARGLKVRRALSAVRLCDAGVEEYESGKAAAIAMGAVHKAANICNAVARGSVAYGRTWSYKT